jgi:hypothetical protein
MSLDSIQPPNPFQAEYEGPIPFTRCVAFIKFVPPSSSEIPKESTMAEADLDAVIRSIGKKQHKTLMDAARKRQARLMGLAAKAKNKETKDRFRETAKITLIMASAAARRLQITAENAADSYARSMKKAIEEMKRAAEEKATKKAAKKKDS